MSEHTSPTPQHGILRKFSYLFGAHWVREVFQTAFMIYLARSFTTTYGEFMLALSIGQMLRFVSECGLNQHLATMLARKADYPSALAAQFTLLKGLLLSLAWLVMLGFIFWQGYSTQLKILVLIIATGVGLEALNSTFFVVLQILGRQDVEGRLRTMGATAGFGFGLAALYAGLAPVIVAFFKLIETVVNFGGATYSVVKRSHFRIDWHKLGRVWETWKGSIVLTLMAIVSIFYNKINIFFLQNAAGAEGVAQYSVTWQTIEGICSLVSGLLLGKVMFPIFARLWVNDQDEFKALARTSARWLMAAAVCIMFVMFIESDRIILLIYGNEYQDAVWMQKYLVPTILFAFIHNLAVFMMISCQRQPLLLGIFVAGLAVNLLLCYYLIPTWPLLGTSLAITCTKGTVALLSVTYCQIRFRMIPLDAVLQLLLAMGLGAGLYFGGRELLFREAAEALALAPVLWLALRWRKEFSKKATAKDQRSSNQASTS